MFHTVGFFKMHKWFTIILLYNDNNDNERYFCGIKNDYSFYRKNKEYMYLGIVER